MFDSLFGAGTPLGVRVVLAIIVVILLIVGTGWLVRRFGADRLNPQGARGRQPRLAVIDAAQVDVRRKLVLIRRDNVEHLVMIGGPTDVVVETNIVRATAAGRDVPARGAGAADALPRAVPLDDATSWPLQPEPGPRQRPNIPEDVGQWPLPAEPGPRAQRTSDPLANLSPDLPSRSPAPRPIVAERPAPPAPPPQAPSDAAAKADHNLADMAFRLEAALRRPGVENRAAPDAPRPAEKAAEPVRAPRPEPRPARVEPKIETPAPEAAKPAEPAKPAFTSLEQEMASLLGRSTSKPS